MPPACWTFVITEAWPVNVECYNLLHCKVQYNTIAFRFINKDMLNYWKQVQSALNKKSVLIYWYTTALFPYLRQYFITSLIQTPVNSAEDWRIWFLLDSFKPQHNIWCPTAKIHHCCGRFFSFWGTLPHKMGKWCPGRQNLHNKTVADTRPLTSLLFFFSSLSQE